jgi:hypothetical protein
LFDELVSDPSPGAAVFRPELVRADHNKVRLHFISHTPPLPRGIARQDLIPHPQPTLLQGGSSASLRCQQQRVGGLKRFIFSYQEQDLGACR